MEKTRKQSWAKRIAIMMIMSILFVFTGCVRYEVKLSIDKDGNTTIELTLAQMQTDASNSGTASLAETKLKYLEAGYEVEDYIETVDGNTYVGIYVKKEGVTLDEAIENMSSGDLDFGSISLSKDEEGVYFLAMNFDSETEQAENNGASSSLMDQYGGYMRFVLEVPGKVVETNATSKSGKKLTWDLLASSDEFIYAKFTLDGGGGFKIPMWVFAVLLGGIIIIGGVILAIMIMSNKKKAEAFTYSSSSSKPSYAEDPDPVKPFTTSQSTGLPQMGSSYNSDATVDDADDTPVVPSADGPIWARPSSDDPSDAIDDLDDDSFLN